MAESYEPRDYVVTETRLPVAAEVVWARATTARGIDDEFRPVARMTTPRRLRDATIDDIPLGMEAGRAWLLLFRLIPFECDRLVLAERGPGHRFLERSSMITYRVWVHERTVISMSDTECAVRDRVGFVLRGKLDRLPFYERLNTEIISALFRHRHRRLVRMWVPSSQHVAHDPIIASRFRSPTRV